MDDNKKFYVYVHFKKDTLEPFYIGKGSGGRYNKTRNRNRYWHNIVNKHGFIPDILEYFDNEQDALDYEKEMIRFFRSEGFTLCNITDGGEGVSGLKHSAQTREKLSAAGRGKSPSEETKKKLSEAMKGRTFSDEARAKMSIARKANPCPPRTLETRAKMSAALKGLQKSEEHKAKIGAANSKIIIATNILTGETFEISGCKHMKLLGFTQSNVSSCALGKRKRHKGHTFKFKDPQ